MPFRIPQVEWYWRRLTELLQPSQLQALEAQRIATTPRPNITNDVV